MSEPKRATGEHPNSLAAKADPTTRALIRKGRREADAHVARLTSWGRSGCIAGVPTTNLDDFSLDGMV